MQEGRAERLVRGRQCALRAQLALSSFDTEGAHASVGTPQARYLKRFFVFVTDQPRERRRYSAWCRQNKN